jgi:hypothetical protein
MTPEQAREIQTRSELVTQRHLNPLHVHRLASQIKSGHWLLTHQAIALDTSGRLIDGQHRIAAIVEANRAVDVVVARDVDPATFHVIDTGRPRNAGNTLQIAGITSAVVVAGAVKMVLKYDATKGTRRLWDVRLAAEITNEDVLTLAQSPRGLLLRGQQSTADHMMNGLGRLGARIPVMVGLTLIREATPDNPATISAFIDKVATGTMLPVNSPLLAYRRWMTNLYPQYPSHQRGYAALIALLKTWQDNIEGTERAVLSVRPGHEALPNLTAPEDPELV